MRTILELSKKAYNARGKADNPTVKSEMYHQIERLAVDHPEMYTEQRFRSELGTQTFKLGICERYIGVCLYVLGERESI